MQAEGGPFQGGQEEGYASDYASGEDDEADYYSGSGREYLSRHEDYYYSDEGDWYSGDETYEQEQLSGRSYRSYDGDMARTADHDHVDDGWSYGSGFSEGYRDPDPHLMDSNDRGYYRDS